MTVNQQEFAHAIHHQYRGMTEGAAAGYAAMWLGNLNPRLYNAVNQWIHAEPITDVAEGDFSIKKILDIRADGDCLKAILLLSEYMADPRRGRARIMQPRR